MFFAVVPYVVFRRRGYDHTRLGRPPPGRGGVAYAVIHTFESWAVYSSPSAGLLTVVFLFLQYLGPGLIKSVPTQRTGNAGVPVGPPRHRPARHAGHRDHAGQPPTCAEAARRLP